MFIYSTSFFLWLIYTKKRMILHKEWMTINTWHKKSKQEVIIRLTVD